MHTTIDMGDARNLEAVREWMCNAGFSTHQLYVAFRTAEGYHDDVIVFDLAQTTEPVVCGRARLPAVTGG